MRKLLLLFCTVLALPALAQAPLRSLEKDKDRDQESTLLHAPADFAGVKDRAGGAHNKSNIGLFFENRGKLYPRRLSQGPSGEYPIGSGRHYLYRINPMVGIPGNVVQGRFTTNEEWEAVGGYHNQALAQIAFSDRPETWPANGWPVRDAQGDPLIRSDQDSYCVSSDSTNTRQMLGLEMHQTGYAYGVKFAGDLLFFKYDVINRGGETLEGLYFSMHIDMDVGNVSGGDPEYADDKIGFERNLDLLYFYDADSYTSEWPGNVPGLMGMAFLRVPETQDGRQGVTDMHYMLYDDYIDNDSLQYGVMASSDWLHQSAAGPRFFHLGALAPNLHFDDLATQDAGGADLVAQMSSGPYALAPGDTLTFVTALVAGIDLNQLLANTRVAHNIVALDFEVARPPERPQLRAVAGNRRVVLYWDDRAERSRDKFTNQFDFEGYRLYKSLDRGATWDQIDRNVNPLAGPDPVPLAAFDRRNGLGEDVGLQYSYVDTNVFNGFEYWYSLTAYDRGDATVESLESPRGATLEEPNVVSVIPRQEALGRTPPLVTTVRQVGTGNTNYRVTVTATDQPGITSGTYTVGFLPTATVARGNLGSAITVNIADLATTTPNTYAVRFTSSSTLEVRDAVTGELMLAEVPYSSGTPFTFAGLLMTITDADPTVPLDFLPEAGDSIVVALGVGVQAGAETLLSHRPLEIGKPYATNNGFILTVQPPASDPRPITYRDVFEFTTAPAQVNAAVVAQELHRVRVVPNPYVVASRFEEEFGQLRREPLRQLKFINLPTECTIYIFTLDGDLVNTLQHSSAAGVATWDMRSASGREIASGVYLYLVKTDRAEKLDRFAVIK